MKAYLGTTSKLGAHLVVAELIPSADDYRVVYPNADSRLLPAIIFEELYREISWHERQLIEATDAEHQISAISDGQPVQVAPCDSFISGTYSPTLHEIVCERCGNLRSSHADGKHKINVTEEADMLCLDTAAKVDQWNLEHPYDQLKLGDTVRIRE